jgi:hypothetical protein
MHPIEAVTLFSALAFEGWGLSFPDKEIPKLFKGNMAIFAALYTASLSLLYFIFTFIWLCDQNIIIQRCGMALLYLSLGSLCMSCLGKVHINWKVFESAASFIALFFITYCRIKGW